MRSRQFGGSLFATLWGATLASLSGCTCTEVIEVADGGGGEGGAQVIVEEACFAESLWPALGEGGIDVVGATLEATYNQRLDATSLEGQVRLVRLDDGAEVPITVTLAEGDQLLQVTPSIPLRYWQTYGLELGGGVRAASGDACAPQSTAFNTLVPEVRALDPRPAPVSGVAMMGSHAVVASQSLPGLQVYDVATPSEPVLTGSVSMVTEPIAIRVEGARAFVPMGYGGIGVFDLSDPATPELRTILGTPGVATEVAPFSVGAREYLAVADGPMGLAILDVTEPEAEVTVATHYFGANVAATQLSLDGERLAVALGDSGFALFDLSDPAAPALLGQRSTEALPETFDAARPARDVLLSGDRLYVAVGVSGIQSFDLSSGEAVFVDHAVGPDGTCTVNCPDVLGDLALSGSTLYATALISGAVRVVDDGSGALSTIEVFSVEPNARALALDGDRLIIGSDAGLQIHDRSDASAPALYLEGRGWGTVRDVDGLGDVLYAAAGGRGLATYDGDFALLDVEATAGVSTDYGGWNVYVNDSIAVLSDARAGFSVFDLANPSDPVKLAEVSDPTFDFVDGVVFAGSIAFVCDGNRFLRSYDLSEPSAPVALGTLAFNDVVGNCNQLALNGPLLYVAGYLGLGVVDVSNPVAMELLNVLVLPGHESITGLALQGDVLYATTFQQDWEAGTDARARRLVAFDVTVSGEPAPIWTSEDLGLGGRLEIRADKIFATANWEGLYVFDISQADAPFLEGQLAIPGDALGMHFEGDTLYVAGRGAGIIPVYVGRTQ
jgi:hypothetical protein